MPEEKPLYDHGTEWTDGIVTNTVFSTDNKFHIGQEVQYAPDKIGKVLDIKDGIYTVSVQTTQSFDESDLKEVIPLDAE